MHNILLSSTRTTSDGSSVLKLNVIVHKSIRKFSTIIIIDQGFEQANAVVKAYDGVFSVTGDPATLRRRMVNGPEVTCLITQ